MHQAPYSHHQTNLFVTMKLTLMVLIWTAISLISLVPDLVEAINWKAETASKVLELDSDFVATMREKIPNLRNKAARM